MPKQIVIWTYRGIVRHLPASFRDSLMRPIAITLNSCIPPCRPSLHLNYFNYNHTDTTKRHSSRMARLSQASIQAILRLQAYRPPPTSYDLMPLSRRAAVLLLLLPDKQGELKVVLTLRSELLRNFAGHVALPGGKADTLTETPEETARREAYEEIGLPLPSHNFVIPVPPSVPRQSSEDSTSRVLQIPTRFEIHHLTQLPCSLSRTNLAVRPCIALLLPSPPSPSRSSAATTTLGQLSELVLTNIEITADIESLLIPRLDPKEVSAVFTVPLESFLSKTDVSGTSWYKGIVHNWYGKEWIMHEFLAPVWSNRAVVAKEGHPKPGVFDDKRLPPEEEQVSRWLREQQGPGEMVEKEETEGEGERLVLRHYRVWGMTSRILVDAARIAYEKEPEFACLEEMGDEGLIAALWDHGILKTERKQGEEGAIVDLFKQEKGNL